MPPQNPAPVPPAQPNPAGPLPPQPAGYTPPSGPTPPSAASPAPLPPAAPVAPGGQIVSGGFNPAAAAAPGTPPSTAQAFVGSFDTPGVTTAQPTINTAVPAAPVTSKRRFMKPLVISLAALIILGGGAALAYVGVIVPNQPANILRSGILNTLQAQQKSTSGTIQDPTGALKVDFTSAVNTPARALDLNINVTASGINFPVEARYVKQSAYIKVGDISTITDLLNTYSPNIGSVAKSLSQQVSNKWIAIDSTLINENPTTKCLANLNWAFSKADIQQLQTLYTKQAFAKINKASADTVNGVAAEKFDLTISNASITKFGASLNSLSLYKAIQKCPGLNNASSAAMQLTANKVDTSTIPLTLWVDKGTKHIVRIAYNSTQNGSLVMNLKYAPVSIDVPSGSVPVLQLVSTLQSTLGNNSDLSQLFSSGGSTPSGGSSSGNANDAKRQSDLKSVQTQLEAFFSQNGYYPSRTDMNSASWLGQNMPSLDQSALQDPDGSSKTLADKPAAKVYAYQPSTDGGTSCENDDTQCTKYTLTGTKSDGSTIVVNNLD